MISFGVGSLIFSGTAMGVAEFWIFLSIGINDFFVYSTPKHIKSLC